MSMCELYPAIDLLGGRCVRLLRGSFDAVSVFDDDPVRMAQHWRDEGATWLHVVDLDGAREGEPRHLEVLRGIVSATGLPVQFSGGLRSMAAIEQAFDAGAARVTLGTAAVRDRALLLACLARWGGRLAVSIDARGGKLAVAGWLQSVAETAAEFAQSVAALGVRTLVVTNVDRDGTLSGADDALMANLRATLPDVQLIAAGGIASLDDVRRLAALGMNGVVLGRALYEGALSLPEALRLIAKSTAEGVRPVSAGEETC